MLVSLLVALVLIVLGLVVLDATGAPRLFALVWALVVVLVLFTSDLRG